MPIVQNFGKRISALLRTMSTSSTDRNPSKTVAVLYQAVPAPSFGGIKKPARPNGYRDSSADVAYGLKVFGLGNLPKSGDKNETVAAVKVVTPVNDPDVDIDEDWSFPDTTEGILAALDKGANIIWANTVLHRQHPLFHLSSESSTHPQSNNTLSFKYVNQLPSHAEDYDDKLSVNEYLRQKGMKNVFPKSWRWEKGDRWADEVQWPCVLKPVRGRGSHGVKVIENAMRMEQHAEKLFKESDVLLIEEFLGGEEITVAVLPPGTYSEPVGIQTKHYSLPAVIRTGHHDYIAPFNGIIPVSQNSRPVTVEERKKDEAYDRAMKDCARAADLLGTRGIVRIDCRRFKEEEGAGAGGTGGFALFDINMKPNATGPGRPGRNDQAALTTLAAGAIGWDYPTFLTDCLNSAIPVKDGKEAAGH